MISKNLQHGIVGLNKGHPQDLFHILFIGKVQPPITSRATMSPLNLSCSSYRPVVIFGDIMCLYSSAILNTPQHRLAK